MKPGEPRASYTNVAANRVAAEVRRVFEDEHGVVHCVVACAAGEFELIGTPRQCKGYAPGTLLDELPMHRSRIERRWAWSPWAGSEDDDD